MPRMNKRDDCVGVVDGLPYRIEVLELEWSRLDCPSHFRQAVWISADGDDVISSRLQVADDVRANARRRPEYRNSHGFSRFTDEPGRIIQPSSPITHNTARNTMMARIVCVG